jgi:hypothetical protein
VGLLQRDLVGRLARKRLARKPIGGLVKALHRGFEFQHISLARKELQLNRYDRSSSMAVKPHWGKLVVCLLPALNGGASGAAFW